MRDLYARVHKATTNCIVGSRPPPACHSAHDSDAVIFHGVACRAFVNFLSRIRISQELS